MAKRIEDDEITRYWQIFDSLVPGPSKNKYLGGIEAAPILKNSRLPEDHLKGVWDLADIDGDGRLDFEEFVVAMRLTYDLVNGELTAVPKELEDWMVPQEKAHLVLADRESKRGHQRSSVMDTFSPDEDGPQLRNGFDWTLEQEDMPAFEEIYRMYKDTHGYITYKGMEEFFKSLKVTPLTEVNNAWNMVNPGQNMTIDKDATIYLLHILQQREDGVRMPTSVPPSLSGSFQKKGIEYNVDRVRNKAAREMADDQTTTGRKAKFSDTYLSRLGTGRDKGYKPRGTDFSVVTAPGFDEAQAKRELRDLDEKLRQQAAARERQATGGARRGADSSAALVRQQLEKMLIWKDEQLKALDRGDAASTPGADLRTIEDDLATLKEQVRGLEEHRKRRVDALAELQAQVQAEKAR